MQYKHKTKFGLTDDVVLTKAGNQFVLLSFNIFTPIEKD